MQEHNHQLMEPLQRLLFSIRFASILDRTVQAALIDSAQQPLHITPTCYRSVQHTPDSSHKAYIDTDEAGQAETHFSRLARRRPESCAAYRTLADTTGSGTKGRPMQALQSRRMSRDQLSTDSKVQAQAQRDLWAAPHLPYGYSMAPGVTETNA